MLYGEGNSFAFETEHNGMYQNKTTVFTDERKIAVNISLRRMLK